MISKDNVNHYCYRMTVDLRNNTDNNNFLFFPILTNGIFKFITIQMYCLSPPVLVLVYCTARQGLHHNSLCCGNTSLLGGSKLLLHPKRTCICIQTYISFKTSIGRPMVALVNQRRNRFNIIC